MAASRSADALAYALQVVRAEPIGVVQRGCSRDSPTGHVRSSSWPATDNLDRKVERVRAEMQAAAESREYERAAELRDQETELLTQRATRQQEWEATHPSLPDVAEACRQLSGEVAGLRAFLHERGIDTQDPTA